MSAGQVAIEERARHCVRVDCRLRSLAATLRFASVGATLIVQGCVPTFFLKQLLQETLRDPEGVAQVDNQVKVTPQKSSSYRSSVGVARM